MCSQLSYLYLYLYISIHPISPLPPTAHTHQTNSSGSACSGQIVFQSEMLGYQDPWVPQWHSQYESIGAKSLTAIRNYVKEVGDGEFPGEELVQLSFLPPPR